MPSTIGSWPPFSLGAWGGGILPCGGSGFVVAPGIRSLLGRLSQDFLFWVVSLGLGSILASTPRIRGGWP